MNDLQAVVGGAPITISAGYRCLDEIASRINAIQCDRYVVITDDVVREVVADVLAALLQRPSLTLTVPHGEAEKTLFTLVQLADSAIGWGATRRTLVVTIGGGVPGNVGGLLASLLFRGLRFVHVPTTAIAAFDSVISLKQAVNAADGKNLVGCYARSEAVLIDLAVLGNLPHDALRSGLCESVKNAVAICPETVNELREVIPEALARRPDALYRVLELSVTAKSSVLRDDAKEVYGGLVLEYGHTVGHAVEFISRMNHGDAIGLGMRVAAEVSVNQRQLPDEAHALHQELLDLVDAPSELPAGVTPETILHAVARDNKRGHIETGPEEIPMVLLAELGQPALSGERPLVPVARASLYDALSAHAGAAGSQSARTSQYAT